MNKYKLRPTSQSKGGQHLFRNKMLRSFLRRLCLVVFLTCTIGAISGQAQFTTYFNPPIFNPTDPFNTDWNEPKNWSWYPGSTGLTGNIKIVIVSDVVNYAEINIPSTTTIEINPGVKADFKEKFRNNGTISGAGFLNFTSDQGGSNYGSINCNSLTSEHFFYNEKRINCNYIDVQTIASNKTISTGECSITCVTSFKGKIELRHVDATFINNGNATGTISILSGLFENYGSFEGEIYSFWQPYEWWGRITNSGTIRLTSPSAIQRMDNNHGSSIIIDSEFSAFQEVNNYGLITNNGEFTIDSNNPEAAPTTSNEICDNHGTIVNNNKMIVAAGAKFSNDGIIKGSGSLNTSTTWNNLGTLSPGNSPGAFNHTGNYTESGTLEIELGGTTAGSTYDVHSVSGTYTAGGTLDVSLIDGFVPATDNSFTIVNAGTRTGNYTTVNLPTLSPGLEWDLDYNPTDITLRVSSTIVPVTWLDFTVKAIDREENKVRLDWSTAEEINNHGFEVERSSDGRTWKKIGFQEAQSKSADQYDYEYIDLKPNKGLNYYRLKQVDYDGAYDYSVVRSINLERDESSFSVFPNPSSTGLMSLSVEQEAAENLNLSILDLSGRIVYSQKVSADQGGGQLSIDTPDLGAGTYIIKLSSKKQHSLQKWVKL